MTTSTQAPRAEPDALVIGAGVIGLTSAVCLAEAGLRVRVRAALSPQQTTSRVAGAIWASSFAEPAADVARWAGAGLQELRALATRPESGVRISRGTLASRHSAEPPSPTRFPGIELDRSDAVPDGYLGAFSLALPLIDMRRYLEYLCGRLADAGVAIEVRPVRRLAELAAQAAIIVNCTGIGARELVPDHELHPVRGEHVIVANPGLQDFFLEEPRAEQWASFFPHGERVVLGGNARTGDWSLARDRTGAQAILARCARVEPRLKGARVIDQQVGLRPARARIRLERARLGAATLIHNYGHGASGVSLSWGCARDVAALALGQ